jgi:N-ATPase, AtpR subunit
MSDLILLRALTYAMLGVALCAAYFSTLRWNIRLYCDRGLLWRALVVHLSRLIGIGAVFTVCACRGAGPLLSTFAGFIMMRTVALHQHNRSINAGADASRSRRTDRAGAAELNTEQSCR